MSQYLNAFGKNLSSAAKQAQISEKQLYFWEIRKKEEQTIFKKRGKEQNIQIHNYQLSIDKMRLSI